MLTSDTHLATTIFRLSKWVEKDPSFRSFELKYRPFRYVGATMWRGGWKVMLWSKRWKQRNPLYYVSATLQGAAEKALANV